MPDISMCSVETCELKTKCYRNAASGTRPDRYAQSYFQPQNPGIECEQFYERNKPCTA